MGFYKIGGQDVVILEISNMAVRRGGLGQNKSR